MFDKVWKYFKIMGSGIGKIFDNIGENIPIIAVHIFGFLVSSVLSLFILAIIFLFIDLINDTTFDRISNSDTFKLLVILIAIPIYSFTLKKIDFRTRKEKQKDLEMRKEKLWKILSIVFEDDLMESKRMLLNIVAQDFTDLKDDEYNNLIDEIAEETIFLECSKKFDVDKTELRRFIISYLKERRLSVDNNKNPNL